jgi:hypothetical protein
MAVPAHTARKATGFDIGNDTKERGSSSLLFKIKQPDYHLAGEQWEELSRKQVTEQLDDLTVNNDASRVANVDSFRHRLTAILSHIIKLFTSTSTDSDPALLDHVSVFATCVRIISRLSDSTHTGERGRK